MIHSSKQDLLNILDKIAATKILVVGDIILDRYIWGAVERISPEAPVPIVDVGKVEDRLGGAGNVVGNLVGLGAEVTLCGYIGDDEEGKEILAVLEKDKVQREGIIIDRDRPTCLKTRVIAHAQQVVRIDREDRATPGVALCEGLAAVVDTNIATNHAVIISDYGKGTFCEPIMRKLATAAKDNRLGLTQGIPLVLDPHPHNYNLYSHISVAKPNRKEAEEATGIKIDNREQAILAAQKLIEKWKAEMILITLGEDGMVLVDKQQSKPLHLETKALEVFDVSGAGDTVTALFTAALASGASTIQAGELANLGAGVVVAEVGTVAISAERLRTAISELVSE